MGIMTDNLQMINRSIQNETIQKTTKKEEKENYVNYLFFEFWNNFCVADNKKNIYLYFKDPTITKKYIKLTYEDRGKDKDGYKLLISFNNLTIPEKMQLYDQTLNKVYNRFKIIEQEEEREKQLKIKEKEKEKNEKEKLLKELYRLQKKHEKIKLNIQKENKEIKQLLQKKQNIHKKGFAKIVGALIIGGRLASKTNKKHKW